MAVSSALGGVVKRREDPRLVTGAGRYTDDVQPAGCLHAVFVRSPHAHAGITGIDVSGALQLHGVVGVFQASDLAFESETARPRLCLDEVKFVGDAIAVAVAATREEAVDAAAAVVVDYEILPALVDTSAALEAGAMLVHPDKGDNLAFEFDLGEDGALESADVVVRSRFINQRLAAVPIEANCVVAEPDGEGGIRMWTSTQVPFGVRSAVADSLAAGGERASDRWRRRRGFRREAHELSRAERHCGHLEEARPPCALVRVPHREYGRDDPRARSRAERGAWRHP